MVKPITAHDGDKENTRVSNTTWSEIREREWQRNVSAQLQSYISSLEHRSDKGTEGRRSHEEEIDEPEDSPYQPQSRFEEKDISDIKSPATMPSCCAYFQDFRIATKMKSTLRKHNDGDYLFGGWSGETS